MQHASKRKPVFRLPKRQTPNQRQDDDEEESLVLREYRKLAYSEQQERAAGFSLEESDDTERRLLLTVAAVYRKLKSIALAGDHNAPGEKFLIELIKLAGHRPLHYYAIWNQFSEFERDWEQRACAMRLGLEDGQDPNDDDLMHNAESARLARQKQTEAGQASTRRMSSSYMR